MRRKDRERDYEFGLGVIDKAPYATVAMTDESAAPYAVALSLVRSENKLYFHCAHEGKKTDILKKNPRVCAVFAADVEPARNQFTTLYKSAVVQGSASLVTDEAEKIMALKLLCLKFCPENMQNFEKAVEQSLPRTAVWCITIEKLWAKCKN